MVIVSCQMNLPQRLQQIIRIELVYFAKFEMWNILYIAFYLVMLWKMYVVISIVSVHLYGRNKTCTYEHIIHDTLNVLLK